MSEDLLAAVCRADVPGVIRCLEAGADPNGGPPPPAHPSGSDDQVVSPTFLMLAATYGHTEVVDVLLRHGADPERVMRTSDTFWCAPITRAAGRGHSAIVRRLLDTSVRANQAHCALALFAAACNGHSDVVALLLEAGVRDTHVWPDTGETALMAAVRSENARIAVVRLLLESGSDVNATDSNGGTALTIVANDDEVDNPVLLDVLLRHGALVDHPTANGLTPLMVAGQKNNAAMAASLLRAGADPLRTDSQGKTALDHALSKDAREHTATALMLFYALPRPSAARCTHLLGAAAESNCRGIVGVLHQHGADLNGADDQHQTPLMRAAAAGHPHMVRDLLGAGAAVDATDDLQQTALGYAACACNAETEANHLQVVTALLQAGAHPLAGAGGIWDRLSDRAEAGAVARLLQRAELAARDKQSLWSVVDDAPAPPAMDGPVRRL